MVKLLALLQVVYLIIQLVARKVAGLPSAQLEIGALAFSVSSIVTYLLYWNRPQGVESVHVFKPKRLPTDNEIETVARFGPTYMWTKQMLRPDYKFEKELDIMPIPNDVLQNSYQLSCLKTQVVGPWLLRSSDIIGLAVGAILGGTLFGGLHCLAWDFDFPTKAESVLWRVCSVVTSILPLVTSLPLGLWIRWDPKGYNFLPRMLPAARFALVLLLLIGCLTPYILALRCFEACSFFHQMRLSIHGLDLFHIGDDMESSTLC